MEEMLETFDIEGNLLKPQTRTFCHSQNPGCYHKAVLVWIINNKGEILVQKRSLLKKRDANKWDVPSAGHIVAGETQLMGCVRETEEELGIKTKESDFIFLKEILNEEGWEFVENYLLKCNTKVEDMVLQEEEVSKIEFLTYDKFVDLFYSKDFVQYPKDYKDWIVKEIKKYIK